LHEDAMHRGVDIQFSYSTDEFFLSDRSRIVDLLRAHTDFLAGARLVADVDLRGRIVAGQDHGEAGFHSALHQSGNLFLQIEADRGGERLAVENFCRHVLHNTTTRRPLRSPKALEDPCPPFPSFPPQTIPTL